ncbi:MAG: DUF7453 family protein [Myxococcota bacterium]
MPRPPACFLLAALGLLPIAPAAAAPGYVVSTVAVEGAAAPGTADTYGAFLDVTLDEAGRVAFSAPLGSGFPAAGVWLDPGSGPVLRFRDGEAAPPPVTGTYIGLGSMVGLDGAGRLAVPIVVNTGSGGVNGLFLDTAGSDSTLLAEGDPAPTAPPGTLDLDLNGLSPFGMNAAGDVSFFSGTNAGAGPSGVFVRAAAGGVSRVAQQGDLLGAGPDAFQGFGTTSLNDAGQVAFAASLAGGSASEGLFLDSGSGAATLALDVDTAPDTGGGTFVDFLMPQVNAGGRVLFLSNVAGGTATGGAFLASPAVSAVAVENQVVPGAGPITTMSLPDLAGDDSVALSLGFGSGPVLAGVYVHASGAFDPVALDGESPPDTGGATFASFGFVDQNDAGQVAFVATLDDGRTGVFLASPAPHVPALPALALAATGALLVLAARGRLRSA